MEDARRATDVKKTLKAETRALMMRKKSLTREKLLELSEALRAKARASAAESATDASSVLGDQRKENQANETALGGLKSKEKGGEGQKEEGLRKQVRVPKSTVEVKVIVKADVQGEAPI